VKLRITIAGNIYEADVEVLEDEEGAPGFAQYASVMPVVPPLMAAPPAGSNGGASQPADGKSCLSPVTGLVIKVTAEPGQAVEANELLMVLEAMKMETQVIAPQAGRIKSVHVVAGNSVKAQQVLLEFE
jgi:methylmalonyl-CoA carboxyltransferase small subunit